LAALLFYDYLWTLLQEALVLPLKSGPI